MKGVENIKIGEKTVAVIFRKNLPVNGLEFLTNNENPFQIGIHHRKKGIILNPHSHNLPKPLIIRKIQEILYVVSGKIRVTIYTKNGKTISKKIMTEGDSILLMDEGHGVEFLQKSRIFEVKQGPYPGPAFAKNYFKKIQN